MSLALFFGYFAGFLTTVALVPQVSKTWEIKSADDFSLAMLLICSCACTLDNIFLVIWYSPLNYCETLSPMGGFTSKDISYLSTQIFAGKYF
jgi:uncharacterized protein with PQ loop repeat